MKLKTLLLIALIPFISAPAILAQTAQGLTAIPPRLEITINPGKVTTKELKVRNESNSEKIIYTSIKDFIVTDDLGTPLQVETTGEMKNRWAASSWLQVSPSQLKIKPGETKSLVITVIAPDDALPGGHYAMVLHSPNNDAVVNQTGAAVQTNVGTLVYITVPGDIKQDASVKDFSAPTFSEYGPIDFQSTITNLSDIHITPAGSVIVKNWLGGKTAQLTLTDTNIFPYTTRDFVNTLNKKWLFGRYTAQLNAAYGTNGQVLVANLIFWVFPWRLMLLVTVVLVLIGVIIYLIKTRPPAQTNTDTQVDELEKELSALKKKYQDKK